MTRFATAGHLVSWAGRAPLDHQSGTRKGRARSKKGNRYLAGVLGETAVAAGRTQTREGARYRRPARRRGKAKAQVAVARSILVIIWHLLAAPAARYTDLGASYYQTRTDTDRKLRNHIRQIQALGFEITLTKTP